MNLYIKFTLVCLLFGVLSITTHASIGGYISASDKKKFLTTLAKAFTVEADDISKSYYAARGFKILNEPYSKTHISEQCAHIKQYYTPTTNIDVTFNALSTWSLLSCPGKLHTDATIKNIQSVFENEKSTTAEIRYALEILTHLKQQIPNPAKIAQLIQVRLKEDDGLLSIGHALHAASLLGNAGKFAHDRIEDVVVQADEIDGKLLQWEGGLTTTSLLITGLLRLPGANPFTQIQADKLANYLLTRKTVQTPKGIVSLLEAAVTLASSSVSPVSISVIGSAQIPQDKPELHVQVSDIFGQPLKPAPSPVIAQSATRISDDVVVLAKQPLVPSKTPTEFNLNLKLDPGYYRVAVNAGSHSSTITTRVLGPLTIKSLEIGLSDADGSSLPKLSKLSYPAKLDSKLQADSSQHLIVKLSISRTVHQAFLRLHSGKKEIIFVAEQDSSKVYKVEVNLASELSYTDNFEMELILGDPIVTNPIRWTLGAIEVNLGASETTPPIRPTRGPKPEIEHLFRQAEKRPPEVMSLFLTGLTAAPLLIVLLLWAKIGVNFGNFTALALPFHLGFGSILGLFTLFWLKLDMFMTCAWLIPIGGFTFLAGHKLLSNLATQRKPEKSDK